MIRKPGGQGRPIPDDFAQIAPTTCQRDLMRIYHTSWRVIDRWCRLTGIKLPSGHLGSAPIPVPEDFEREARRLSTRALAKHYGRDRKTVERWFKDTGITPRPYDRAAARPRSKPFNRTPAEPRRQYRPFSFCGANPLPPRDDTLTGRAADFLRRKSPVYRCDRTGRANPAGKFWRIGVSCDVLTAEGLVEKAEARGFDAREWARVA
jgi:hypothetical protein